jgi:outer membrane protein assembly factor BamB
VDGSRLLSFDLRARAIGYQIKSAFTGQLALANGTIYIQNGKAIEARRESDGSLQWLWTPPEGQPVGPTIVTKNVLFTSTTANTYAVDLATQRQVWAYPAGGALSLSSQGVLFIAQTTGNLTAISVR